MTDPQPDAPKNTFALVIDKRDVIGGAGFLLALVGAALIHPGLATLVLGGALIAVAWRLSR
jgi:hypothetical protein